ncbi:unnamed protein product [Spirodela intermedia]|uniref:Uncharacterized protein n=1 Tax=Spirodela intermedia TaxID=51605 RepID=A0A7I8KPI6_SPIIN|nr:unnamed protein product [Spirodela intermedia]
MSVFLLQSVGMTWHLEITHKSFFLMAFRLFLFL